MYILRANMTVHTVYTAQKLTESEAGKESRFTSEHWALFTISLLRCLCPFLLPVSFSDASNLLCSSGSSAIKRSLISCRRKRRFVDVLMPTLY